MKDEIINSQYNQIFQQIQADIRQSYEYAPNSDLQKDIFLFEGLPQI